MKNIISKYKISGLAMLCVLGMTSCEDLFEPANENIRDIDAMYTEPTYAQGLLGNAYILLPYSTDPSSDMATDDAVANNSSSSYLKMATGGWTSEQDPLSKWKSCYNAIQYVNIVLENCNKVAWASDEKLNSLYQDLFRGDAYAMRAIHMFYLLRAHAGEVDGQMMGVPIMTQYLDANADFNLERAPLKQCVDSVMSDIDKALSLLPDEYKDIVTENEMPAKYQAAGITMANYNRAFGAHQRGKVNGNILHAIKAQVALWAASPAFSAASGVTYADAAAYAAQVIKNRELASNGLTWYDNATEIDNLEKGENSAECIWQTTASSSTSLEESYFPPSIYGGGGISPSQNLVDAFPTATGYPIDYADASKSGYNEADPYANRDPRLAKYIVLNGSTMGAENKTILTGTYYTDATDKMSNLNAETGKSTRTGYYMRKLLRSDVNLNSTSKTAQNHYTARIRLTELYLDYAEAVNEAYGPYGTVPASNYTMTAYDIIKMIRERAGITDTGYLKECADGGKEKMRELIRNERRLELCFENQRFYDLRRWKVDLGDLNMRVIGMSISKDATTGKLVYTTISQVEERKYQSYQYYGPIPYSECIKYSNLKQNTGW